jgi:hypothetical protein
LRHLSHSERGVLQALVSKGADWTFLEAGDAFFLVEIIPFPKLIRNFFRIAAFIKHFSKGELGFAAHERSRSD